MQRLIRVTTFMSATILAFGQNQVALTNADITRMAQNGLPENVIAGAMKANDTNFDLSPDALIALSKAGLSLKVLEAMLEAGAAKRGGIVPQVSSSFTVPGQPGAINPAVSTGPSFPGAFPGAGLPGPSLANGMMTPAQNREATVAVVLEKGTQLIPVERLESVRTTAKASRLTPFFSNGLQDASSIMLTMPVVGMLFGGIGALGNAVFRPGSGTITSLWGLPGKSSNNLAVSSLPKFEVNFADIPGVNPDEFEPRMVKLNPTKENWRLLGVTQMKETPSTGQSPAWPSYSSFLEEPVPAKTVKLLAGQVLITPEESLEAGQYAVVLRPRFKDKRFSGEAITKSQGEGALFNAAWSFAIGPEAAPTPRSRYQVTTNITYHIPASSSEELSTKSTRETALRDLGATTWEFATDAVGVTTYVSPDRRTMLKIQDVKRPEEHVLLVDRFDLGSDPDVKP